MCRPWGKLPDLRRVYNDEEAHDILRSCGLKYDHTANDCRYISKKIGYGICELYSGHYGQGIIVHRANNRIIGHTHGIIEYWIEEGD